MLKTYRVTYDGLWLGGKAIVRAETEEEAIRHVLEHEATEGFRDVYVEEIKVKRGVVYNDCGDY